MLQPPPAFRFATLPASGSGGHATVQWLLKRHCSVTPAQLGWVYLSLCVMLLGIAMFAWSRGATLVMPFAAAEMVAVGIAFLLYARHAADSECIILQGDRLLVELERAGRIQRFEFNRRWVRIEPEGGDGSLIQLSGQGRLVKVGRHLRPEMRPALAREIRHALRGC